MTRGPRATPFAMMTTTTRCCFVNPSGTDVDTWRENYPYDERMKRDDYEEQKRLLQIELLKLQKWSQANGLPARHRVRGPRRRGQGRHHQAVHGAPQPARRPRRRAGEAHRAGTHPVVLPALRPPPARRTARSCCSTGPGTTAPGVERVMGFCTAKQHAEFIRQVPLFEQMLVNDGISLTKLWFSVTSVRAAHPVHHPPGRPGPAVETVADRPRVAGQVGRLHRGQGGHVRAGRTPRSRRGRWSRATTRSAPASTPCATC